VNVHVVMVANKYVFDNNYDKQVLAVCGSRELAVAAAQDFMAGEYEDWRQLTEARWENGNGVHIYIEEKPLIATASGKGGDK
jgi:hypothetical protein